MATGRVQALPLLGGAPCLDFVNTLEWRHTSQPMDALASFDDLVRWSVRAETLPADAAEPLLRRAQEDVEGASTCLGRAVELRELLYAAFAAVAAEDGEVANEVLDAAAGALTPLLAATRYAVRGRVAGRLWAGAPDAWERLLWPIAFSAHDLLTGDDLARVRECADGACHWLFIDRSRNRSRRWCGMTLCGNVAKARRFRRKLRDP